MTKKSCTAQILIPALTFLVTCTEILWGFSAFFGVTKPALSKSENNFDTLILALESVEATLEGGFSLECQGNLLKGIDNKTVRRYGISNALFSVTHRL